MKSRSTLRKETMTSARQCIWQLPKAMLAYCSSYLITKSSRLPTDGEVNRYPMRKQEVTQRL